MSICDLSLTLSLSLFPLSFSPPAPHLPDHLIAWLQLDSSSLSRTSWLSHKTLITFPALAYAGVRARQEQPHQQHQQVSEWCVSSVCVTRQCLSTKQGKKQAPVST